MKLVMAKSALLYLACQGDKAYHVILNWLMAFFGYEMIEEANGTRGGDHDLMGQAAVPGLHAETRLMCQRQRDGLKTQRCEALVSRTRGGCSRCWL